MQVWEAIEPRADAYLGDDCVNASAAGDCNAFMAGGDFDGDLNMLSFNPVLLALADATAPRVTACGWEAIEKAWRAHAS